MPTGFRALWKALTADPAVVEALHNRRVNQYSALGGTNVSAQMRAAYQRMQDASYAWMYLYQPSVRSVVDLIAENVSQLGLKLYERVSETEREPDNEHPAALSLRYPNDATPQDQWVQEFVSDWLVHDNAYALIFARGAGSQVSLIRLLPHMVGVLGQGYAVTGYRIYRVDGSFEDVDPDRILHWRRYNPEDPRIGKSRLETLRQELTEDTALQSATTEIARNNLRGDYIKRPLEAPEMSREAADRFAEDWHNQRMKGPGWTPILEEGMELISSMISPKDAELLATREATKESVAQLYGVPVGLLTGEGDQEQEIKRFYKDVLAPVSKKLAGQLDHTIVQRQFMATDRYFVFNLTEKLRGDMEARFAAQTASVGRPWRTVNEARASEDLPPMTDEDADADGLTIPLNVELSGKPTPALPAPNIMPIQDPNKPPQDGSYREEPQNRAINGNGKATHLIPRRVSTSSRKRDDAKRFEALLRRHFRRQESAMKSDLTKAADDAHYDTELAADLYGLNRTVVVREGQIAAARMADTFNTREITHYLQAMSSRSAADINRKTEERILAVGAVEAFEEAVGNRAVVGGITQATEVFAWASKEALNQASDRRGRMVTVSGGSCPECEPYQGVWNPEELDQWPPYHGNCDCIAEVG